MQSWPSTPNGVEGAPPMYTLHNAVSNPSLPSRNYQDQKQPQYWSSPPAQQQTPPTGNPYFSNQTYSSGTDAWTSLPQVSFTGGVWPVRSLHELPSTAPQTIRDRPHSLTAKQPVSVMAPPPPRRSPLSRSYDGFLWPCNSGAGESHLILKRSESFFREADCGKGCLVLRLKSMRDVPVMHPLTA